MLDAVLTIGEVAREAGLKTSAIRYYESIGVLPEPERDAGQRRYAPDAIGRLRLIGVAKQAGFSLAETRALLAADADGAVHAELRELAALKLPRSRRRSSARRRRASGCSPHVAARAARSTIASCSPEAPALPAQNPFRWA
jgi:MerR family transcriptional regulator, redox-sensitive transcriptional activator SoxR